jgi:hypothetical protein
MEWPLNDYDDGVTVPVCGLYSLCQCDIGSAGDSQNWYKK